MIAIFKVIFSLIFISKISANPFFVSPVPTPCSATNSCNGDILTPFDNLFDAFTAATPLPLAYIVLLYSSSADHYVMKPSSTADPETNVQYAVNNLILKPLYCVEEPVLSNPALLTSCIYPGQNITVNLKTVGFTLLIQANVVVQGIVFDAAEDIWPLNTNTAQLQDCVFNRKKCCQAGQTPSTLYPSTVSCAIQGTYSSSLRGTTNSLFVFSQTAGSSASPASLLLQGVGFQNFLSPHLRSLIRTTKNYFNLTLSYVAFDRVYFDKGIISHGDASSPVGSSVTANMSKLTMSDVSFTNYNPWDLVLKDQTRTEGYLFNAEDTFSGVFKMTRTTFTGATSSLRDSCWAQTATNYQAPMSNLLNTNPRSRSDLWGQVYAEKSSLNNYISSLIYIKALSGSMAISTSSFKNIIGTSGSVIRVDDILANNNWITIYFAMFDGNFAYDKFANIMITKTSNPQFYSMLSAPRIEVVNASFTTSRGCPGAYGNVLLLNSWDSTAPKGSLTSYSLSTQIFSLLTAWTSTSDTTSYIRVKNTYFVNNMLSVSNSLAIVCSHFTILESNVFQGNGGTTAELAAASLAMSYFGQRYPLRLAALPITSFTHFGQSTAVYFDHVFKMFSRNNIYSGNWGPWEGSLALSTVITIKNWLKVSLALQFTNDYFGDHQGIPSILSAVLSDSSLQKNLFMDPLVSLSVDEKGTSMMASQLSALSSAISSASVIMYKTGFVNNAACYNYSDYTYNNAELSSIKSTIRTSMHYQSGFVKFLWPSEALDDFSVGFSNDATTSLKPYLSFTLGLIDKNQLKGTGCLFSSVASISYTQISNNMLFVETEHLEQQNTLDPYFLDRVPTTHHALFCVQITETLDFGYNLKMMASNLIIKHNQGILFNALASTKGRNNVQSIIYITDSVFFDNKCIALSMITIRNYADLISINNLFVYNNNTLGNVLLYTQASTNAVFNGHFQNYGTFSSVYYTYGITSKNILPSETLGQVYWNDVNPQFPTQYLDLLASAGLYYLSSSRFQIFSSDIRQNPAYSGIMTAFQSDAYIYYTQFLDHNISGSSVVGSFMGLTTLYISNVLIKNSTIMQANTLSNNVPSFFVFYSATIIGDNIEVDGGTAVGMTYLLFSNALAGIIQNLKISNVYCNQPNKKSALMQFTFSTVWIVGLQTQNTTGLFSTIATEFHLYYSSISGINSFYDSQFVVDMYKTKLYIDSMQYTGDLDGEGTLTLIGGEQNLLTVLNSQFTNANRQNGLVFKCSNCLALQVGNCIFTYDDPLTNVTIFSIPGSEPIYVQENIFIHCGAIFSVSDVTSDLLFIGNTIITASHMQNFLSQSSLERFYFHNNQIIGTSIGFDLALPESQIKIITTQGVNNVITSILDNVFFGLMGQNAALQISIDGYNFPTSILQNVFLDNTGDLGGALQISTQGSRDLTLSTFLVKSCYFLSNSATRGGAIYQTTPDKTAQNTVISQSVFYSNTAQNFGGAVYFDYSIPIITTDSFFESNHAATEINHMGAYPVRIALVDNTHQPYAAYLPGTPLPSYSTAPQSFQWKSLPSGSPTDLTYNFALIDMFNQILYSDSVSTLEMYPLGFDTASRPLFSLDYSTPAQSGYYVLDDFQLNYKVGQSVNITFTSTAIPTTSPFPTSTSFLVSASFRKCNMGEYVVPSGGLTSCKSCPSGFWYVNPFKPATVCDACDPESTICLGGNNAGPRQGYWRLNETADVVLECPRAESCIGNDDIGPNDAGVQLEPLSVCAPTYTGHLCDACIDGWAKGSDGDCVNCSTNVLSYLLLFGMMILQAVTIGLGVKETMQSGEEYSGETDAESNSGTLIRIYMNYSQVFSLLVGIPVVWPAAGTPGVFINISTRISSASNQLFTLDCFFLLGKNAFNTSVVFLKALLTATNPYLFTFGAIIFWLAYFKIKKRSISANSDFCNLLITTIVIISFNMQPAIIQSGFYLFQCQNIYRHDTPLEYLVTDSQVECWTGQHLAWTLALVIPSLILWVAVFPGLLFSYLNKHKDKLQTFEIAKKYSFIYDGYKTEKFYWEFLIMIRKILMISACVFAGFNSPSLQIYLFIALILISYALHVINRPFTEEILNDLERISLVSLIIVALCGLYFQIITEAGKFDKFVFAVGVLGYLYFGYHFCKLYFALYIEKLKNDEKAMKRIAWVKKHLCCFLKNTRVEKTLSRLKTFSEKFKTGSIELQKRSLDNPKNDEEEDASKIDVPEESSQREDLTLSQNKFSILRKGAKRINMFNKSKFVSQPDTKNVSLRDESENNIDFSTLNDKGEVSFRMNQTEGNLLNRFDTSRLQNMRNETINFDHPKEEDNLENL